MKLAQSPYKKNQLLTCVSNVVGTRDAEYIVISAGRGATVWIQDKNHVRAPKQMTVEMVREHFEAV